jgi:signal recognition particle GTPase
MARRSIVELEEQLREQLKSEEAALQVLRNDVQAQLLRAELRVQLTREFLTKVEGGDEPAKGADVVDMPAPRKQTAVKADEPGTLPPVREARPSLA